MHQSHILHFLSNLFYLKPYHQSHQRAVPARAAYLFTGKGEGKIGISGVYQRGKGQVS